MPDPRLLEHRALRRVHRTIGVCRRDRQADDAEASASPATMPRRPAAGMAGTGEAPTPAEAGSRGSAGAGRTAAARPLWSVSNTPQATPAAVSSVSGSTERPAAAAREVLRARSRALATAPEHPAEHGVRAVTVRLELRRLWMPWTPAHARFFRLGSEILTGIDEAIRLELVLLVVQLSVASVEREQLGVRAALDDLPPRAPESDRRCGSSRVGGR